MRHHVAIVTLLSVLLASCAKSGRAPADESAEAPAAAEKEEAVAAEPAADPRPTPGAEGGEARPGTLDLSEEDALREGGGAGGRSALLDGLDEKPAAPRGAATTAEPSPRPDADRVPAPGQEPAERKGDDARVRDQPALATFLPRTGYFENTYLGGDAAHEERLRRLRRELGPAAEAVAAVHAATQPFDPPEGDAVGLHVAMDRRWVDDSGRVFLQVGLQGSARYGWRRPPLDVVVVLDAGEDASSELLTALLRRLGPRDRLGVVQAGAPPRVLVAPEPARTLRTALPGRLDALGDRIAAGPEALEDALDRAGALLREAAGDEARVPGSQVVLLATEGGGTSAQVEPAARATHRLTLQGATTSVLALGSGGDGAAWWRVAAAGHGHLHRVEAPDAASLAAAVGDELTLLARVVARLVRVDVRLAPGVRAVRILGSRMLGQEEVVRVKAREVAVDRQLSRTMGVTADRGEDDEGLQTVIPAFHGGHSHVILLELQVEGPGPVADVVLRYKDMITLDNATARAAAELRATPRPATPQERLVQRNVQRFELADALRDGSRRLLREGPRAALAALQDVPVVTERDARVMEDLRSLVRAADGRGAPLGAVADALAVAAARRTGLPPDAATAER